MSAPSTVSDIRKKAVSETARAMIARHLAGKPVDAAVQLQSYMDRMAGVREPSWVAYGFKLLGYSVETLESIADEAQAKFDAAIVKDKPVIRRFDAKSKQQKAAAKRERNARKAV